MGHCGVRPEPEGSPKGKAPAADAMCASQAVAELTARIGRLAPVSDDGSGQSRPRARTAPEAERRRGAVLCPFRSDSPANHAPAQKCQAREPALPALQGCVK